MNGPRKRPDELRSARWYGAMDIRGFAHRQRSQQMGLRRSEFLGKPVIGIINTWSDLSPCHAHLRDRADAVKRGVWQAGGYPVEMPALSVGEVMVKPTTMLYRNLLAMEVEEILRSHPIDGCVLLGGCDKSTPGMLMGAISMDLPTIFCPAGPMSNGQWRGQIAGAGTHTKKYFDQLRTGKIDAEDWVDLESRMTRTAGTCNTMGTASTMTAIVDAIGLSPTGASSIPAVDSGHPRMAAWCGERITQMVFEDLKPSDVITCDSLRNGVVAYMALGGSTNAAIHLIAITRRAGLALTLDDMAQVAETVDVLADIYPSGRFLMEDFFFAGGLPALLTKVKAHLNLECRTVENRTLGDAIAGAECWNDEVIREPDNPAIVPERGRTLSVLRGNLAPEGAVIKTSAASLGLLVHEGPALVFDNPREMMAAIDDPELDVTADTVLILRNAGPVGAPGMPEWGNIPIPRVLLDAGIEDVVRISDGRMSGTHFGTCILHVSPESAVGGPLGLVRTGDVISIDVPAGRLEMRVSDAKLADRRHAWAPTTPLYERSFAALYQRHVGQAHEGCDFDFLSAPGSVPEPEIF